MISARLRILIAAQIAAAALVGAPAQAQTPSWSPEPRPHIIEDRLRAEVSLLGAGIDTRLRIDRSPTVQGSQIDAEDDLGLEDAELMLQAEITLLPGKHHLLRFSSLSTRRSASALIDREIFFDDQVYEPGERVDSELNLKLFGLTYGYRFIARERAELTGTFGVQIAAVEANAVVRSRVVREAESGVAPLPLVGLEGRYDFTDRWSLEGRLQYLHVNIEDVNGSLLDARLAVTWRLNPYLVFGLGYRSFAIEVDSHDRSNPGLVDMTIAGPLLFARASL